MSLCQDGATTLILAAQMSRVELCVFLLDRGANANIQDNQGRYLTVNVQLFICVLWQRLTVAAAETLTDGATHSVRQWLRRPAEQTGT